MDWTTIRGLRGHLAGCLKQFDEGAHLHASASVCMLAGAQAAPFRRPKDSWLTALVAATRSLERALALQLDHQTLEAHLVEFNWPQEDPRANRYIRYCRDLSELSRRLIRDHDQQVAASA